LNRAAITEAKRLLPMLGADSAPKSARTLVAASDESRK
jgi:hypothetical protein